MDDKMKEKIKDDILRNLNNGVTPTYRRCGISNLEFIEILEELKCEGYLSYNLIDITLPNGQPDPYNGEVKDITLK